MCCILFYLIYRLGYQMLYIKHINEYTFYFLRESHKIQKLTRISYKRDLMYWWYENIMHILFVK